MLFDLSPLDGAPRLLLEAELKPLQGSRFQPTGFPNLGAARYSGPAGEELLLVESNQSMANWLEAACWDTAADDWKKPLIGMPLIRVSDSSGKSLTNSVLEAHRLNSPYIENSSWFSTLKAEIGYNEKTKRAVDLRGYVYPTLLKYDPNSLVHGFFLESISGSIRSPRVIAAFIEAEGVNIASSGGVKNDRVDASGKAEGGGASEGYGNVPFARDEFTARKLTAYFNVDLAQIRGMGLGAAAERFLIVLSVYKIQSLLTGGLRLRTACDLDVKELHVARPSGFVVPSLDALALELQKSISVLSTEGRFAAPPETKVIWEPKAQKPAKTGAKETDI
jgi:CRISPR-associated protein Csb1